MKNKTMYVNPDDYYMFEVLERLIESGLTQHEALNMIDGLLQSVASEDVIRDRMLDMLAAIKKHNNAKNMYA